MFIQTLASGISTSLKTVCARKNLLWQVFACVVTYVCVVSGFDWWYLEHTRAFGMTAIPFGAVILGFLFPVVVPVLCIFVGTAFHKARTRLIGYAMGQAAILGWLLSTFYKVFTGRPGPHGMRGAVGAMVDISHQFRFGFYRGGAFQGWPSSHTATAFAMAFALIAFFPSASIRDRSIRVGALVYAFYIGIGVSMNIHWFSDFAAGAILGALIGTAVGAHFYAKTLTVEA